MAPIKAEPAATSSSPIAGAADGAGTTAREAARGIAGGGSADLPLHLMEKILYCVRPLASARLATVCRSWAAAVSERLARPVPHLFLYLPADATSSDRCGIVVSVDVGSGGRLPPAAAPSRVRLADTNGMRCVGATPGGRLAFANWWWNDPRVVLVNPVTGARQTVRVESPRRDPVLVAGGGGGGDSFVSVGAEGLALHRRAATGGEWSRWGVAAALHQTSGIVSAAADRSGRLYLLDVDGHVSTVDAAAPPPLRLEKLQAASLFDHFAPPRLALVEKEGHLLEAGGEVLYVRPLPARGGAGRGAPFCGHGDAKFVAVGGFQVYRLDVHGRRWAKVDKLAGDRALFVSPGSSFAVRPSETEGCRSNCIYFVGKNWYCSYCHGDDGNSWGVYSMEEQKVLFQDAVSGPGPCSSALWFLPSVV